MSTIDELTAMKKKLDDDRVEKARLEGQLADRMARLKDLGFADTGAAEARLEEMHDEIAGLDDSVQRGLQELHDKYGL